MVDMVVAAIIGKSMNPLDEFDDNWALSVSKIAAFVLIRLAEESAIGLTL
jgi:hypothetical protein